MRVWCAVLVVGDGSVWSAASSPRALMSNTTLNPNIWNQLQFTSASSAMKLWKQGMLSTRTWVQSIGWPMWPMGIEPPNWFYSNKFVVGVDTEIKSKMVKFGNIWQCSDCDYSSSKSTNLYRHVESKHVATQFYPCPKCGKHFKGSNSYSVHMYTAHKYSFWNKL